MKCDSEMSKISILFIFRKVCTSCLLLSKPLVFQVAIRRMLNFLRIKFLNDSCWEIEGHAVLA